MRIFIISIAILFTLASTAVAQTKVETYKDWTVYTVDMQGKKTCYIASFPQSKSGNYSRRDEPYFMVTYLGDNVAEVSTSSGYKYANGSKVDVSMGERKFSMFTSGELAWADNRKEDHAFVSAMQKFNFMSVKGTSLKNTYSIDKYSLAGFTAAYEKMKKVCN